LDGGRIFGVQFQTDFASTFKVSTKELECHDFVFYKATAIKTIIGCSVPENYL